MLNCAHCIAPKFVKHTHTHKLRIYYGTREARKRCIWSKIWWQQHRRKTWAWWLSDVVMQALRHFSLYFSAFKLCMLFIWSAYSFFLLSPLLFYAFYSFLLRRRRLHIITSLSLFGVCRIVVINQSFIIRICFTQRNTWENISIQRHHGRTLQTNEIRSVQENEQAVDFTLKMYNASANNTHLI